MNTSERTVLFVAWPQFDPAEIAFWRRLRDHLHEQGLRLVMASTSQPPANFDVPHIGIPSLDTYWPDDPAAAPTIGTFGLDAAFLLEREEAWASHVALPALVDNRRRGLDAMVRYWFRAIMTFEPVVVVIWNGQHVAELILDTISRAFSIPVLYVERAPIAQAMFADDRGLSAASAIAREESWPAPAAEWQARAAAVIRRIASDARQTWWEQPASRNADRQSLRQQLDIPAQSLVLMFAGQIDGDTQQFLFSPHFDSNVAAFAWLLQQLRGRDDVYVLGKQHPKSPHGRAYRRALADSGVPGAWRADVSIADALTVADRVVAVNSTVLYEALARELPVLVLGEWLLSERGAAYEARGPVHGRQAVAAWLAAAEAQAHQRIWRDSLAFLLSSCLYASTPDAEALGLPGTSDLAARIRQTAERSPRPTLPIEQRVAEFVQAAPLSYVPPRPAAPQDMAAWERVHRLHMQLLHAASAARLGQRAVIWGTGAAGRLAAALVERMGGIVDAFTSSATDGSQFDGTPCISPEDLRLNDVILLATLAADEIAPSLVARGFTNGLDFHVLDCHLLAAQGASIRDELLAKASR